MTWDDPHQEQLELFDVGETQKSDYPPSGTCTPFAPGTGPEGEKCGTCKWKIARHNHSGKKRFLKCMRVRHHWTNGGASDIKARWPACYSWRPKGFSSPDAAMAVWPDGWPDDSKNKNGLLIAADKHDDNGDTERATLCRKLAHTSFAEYQLGDEITF